MRPPEFLRFGIFNAYLFVNYVYEDPFFFYTAGYRPKAEVNV